MNDAMKPFEAIREHRDDVRRIVGQNRTCYQRVFGYELRGEDANDSDLDLLFDSLPGATLFNLGALQVELEQVLGASIDWRYSAQISRAGAYRGSASMSVKSCR
jgi:predicted nucleotidyltransferase